MITMPKERKINKNENFLGNFTLLYLADNIKPPIKKAKEVRINLILSTKNKDDKNS
jgi:hypothetical protein